MVSVLEEVPFPAQAGSAAKRLTREKVDTRNAELPLPRLGWLRNRRPFPGACRPPEYAQPQRQAFSQEWQLKLSLIAPASTSN